MQTSTYHIIEALANKLDHDQLLERLMDKLICFTWEYENEIGCFETARMFAIYIELFGRALEKVTKPKEWMLYLPFVTNCLKKALGFIEPILIKKSSLSHRARSSSTWDQVVFIVTDSVLDLAEFVHAVTVNKKPSEFPVGCEDIGSEDGDVRRRYLGYFLLNLIYEKIILNLDIQLSRTYFEKHHARYNVKGPKRQTDITTHCEYTTNIIQRCTKLSVLYGFSFSRMYQLLTSVCARQEFSLLSKEDEVLENDKQMINPRLYPLSYEGIACLFSMTLYDKKDVKLDMLPMAKDYIGISMNLILRPTEMINHVDKGLFVLLYFSDNINAAINMNDIDKEIRGPLGLESKFPVSRILQIISSVASICPDPSIRFFSYQLLQKFLDFSDDETCVFFLQELLDRCPFPSMKTAAIGLLKDQIDQSFNANCNNRQLFKSPLVVQVFVPIIFKINSIWLTRPSEFWNDYGHIMQALNLYYYLLLKDEQNNWTTVWIPQNIDQMKKKYLNPIKNCLNDIALIPTDDENSAFYTMQIEIMKDLLHKIDQKIN